MLRAGLILGLLGILIGLAVAEQVVINNVYGHMKKETAAIIKMVESHEDTHNPDNFKFGEEVKERVDGLHSYWLGRERNMSIIVRFVDLSLVSDALIYARNFIHFDNKEEAMAGLSRLEYLVQSYKHAFGLNGVNIL